MLVLEHRPVVICQCHNPCYSPFRNEDGEWSELGCLRWKGHPGDHGLDESQEDKPLTVGPRVVLRFEDGMWTGNCHRCDRLYSLAEVGKSAVAAQ